MEKKLNYNSNIIFQNAETRKVCKKMFQIKKGDNDGCILASAIYLKQCYPFRKVILLTNDKELKLRCKLFGIGTSWFNMLNSLCRCVGNGLYQVSGA